MKDNDIIDEINNLDSDQRRKMLDEMNAKEDKREMMNNQSPHRMGMIYAIGIMTGFILAVIDYIAGMVISRNILICIIGYSAYVEFSNSKSAQEMRKPYVRKMILIALISYVVFINIIVACMMVISVQ